jgi:transcriptional regulator with XRE-family HTH domain
MAGNEDVRIVPHENGMSSHNRVLPDASMKDDPGFYAEVGRRISDARKSARLTQDELAKRLAMNRSSVARIETGKQRYLAHALRHIAHVLGVPHSSLIPETPQKSGKPVIMADSDQAILNEIINEHRQAKSSKENS